LVIRDYFEKFKLIYLFNAYLLVVVEVEYARKKAGMRVNA
jgi:hypothetical protein